jgi:hypothetical protein
MRLVHKKRTGQLWDKPGHDEWDGEGAGWGLSAERIVASPPTPASASLPPTLHR